MIGLASEQGIITTGNTTTVNHYILLSAGTFSGKNKTSSQLRKIENGSVVTVKYDSNKKEILFSVDNESPVVGFTNVTGPLYPAVEMCTQGSVVALVL